MQKPKRIKDPTAIEAARLMWCEYCGTTRGHLTPHHIKSVGSGGNDVPSNLVCLCIECHTKVHSGPIPKSEMKLLAEIRETLRVDGEVRCNCGETRLIWNKPCLICPECGAVYRGLPF